MKNKILIIIGGISVVGLGAFIALGWLNILPEKIDIIADVVSASSAGAIVKHFWQDIFKKFRK